jgi:hypothetical protein
MAIVAVGLDLAKNVLALHGVNDSGLMQLRQPRPARHELNEVVAALPPSFIRVRSPTASMTACRFTRSHLARHSTRPTPRTWSSTGPNLLDQSLRDRSSLDVA